MFMDPDSKLIKLLMETYNEGMQIEEKPLAIGGGTYARIVKTVSLLVQQNICT